MDLDTCAQSNVDVRARVTHLVRPSVVLAAIGIVGQVPRSCALGFSEIPTGLGVARTVARCPLTPITPLAPIHDDLLALGCNHGLVARLHNDNKPHVYQSTRLTAHVDVRGGGCVVDGGSPGHRCSLQNGTRNSYTLPLQNSMFCRTIDTTIITMLLDP